MDINTGLMRNSAGMLNMYDSVDEEDSLFLFPDDLLQLYGQSLSRILDRVKTTFHVPTLYQSAPTFFALLVGEESWEPLSLHDMYFGIHADRNNTPHYHYSGLLYLSTEHEDFGEGGTFFMYDPSSVVEQEPSLSVNVEQEERLVTEARVEPRKGRVVLFSSGPENPHRVSKVGWGERLTLSLWFTCDEERVMDVRLDRKPHYAFKKMKGSPSESEL